MTTTSHRDAQDAPHRAAAAVLATVVARANAAAAAGIDAVDVIDLVTTCARRPWAADLALLALRDHQEQAHAPASNDLAAWLDGAWTSWPKWTPPDDIARIAQATIQDLEAHDG